MKGKNMKIKKMLCLVIAIITLFAFATTALAGDSYASWSSTVCNYGFTASATLTRTYGEWCLFAVDADEVYWPSGDSGWDHWIKATPKNDIWLYNGRLYNSAGGYFLLGRY